MFLIAVFAVYFYVVCRNFKPNESKQPKVGKHTAYESKLFPWADKHSIHSPKVSPWEVWKHKLNAMSKSAFNAYRKVGVYTPIKPPGIVSKAYFKLKWIHDKTAGSVHANDVKWNFSPIFKKEATLKYPKCSCECATSSRVCYRACRGENIFRLSPYTRVALRHKEMGFIVEEVDGDFYVLMRPGTPPTEVTIQVKDPRRKSHGKTLVAVGTTPSANKAAMKLYLMLGEVTILGMQSYGFDREFSHVGFSSKGFFSRLEPGCPSDRSEVFTENGNMTTFDYSKKAYANPPFLYEAYESFAQVLKRQAVYDVELVMPLGTWRTNFSLFQHVTAVHTFQATYPGTRTPNFVHPVVRMYLNKNTPAAGVCPCCDHHVCTRLPNIPVNKETVEEFIWRVRNRMPIKKSLLDGKVLELGTGKGGWTQYTMQQPEVREITTVQYPGPGHEQPLWQGTPNSNKVTQIMMDVHDLNPSNDYDVVISDIGESQSNLAAQREYSKKKRENFSRIVDTMYRMPRIVYKELDPSGPGVKEFCKKYRLGFLRTPYSRNSSSEVYLVSGGNSLHKLDEVAEELIRRMNKTPPKLNYVTSKLDDEVENDINMIEEPEGIDLLPKIDDTLSIMRLKERYHSLVEGAQFIYRSVKEIAWIDNVGDTIAGEPVNFVMRKLLVAADDARRFLTQFHLTDTSAKGTFDVYKKKVDTVPRENHKHRDLERAIMIMLALHFKKKMTQKGFVNRMLTYDEAIANLRNDIFPDRDWKEDPGVRKRVEEELKLMEEGKTSRNIVYTMGKREKKRVGAGGNRKGSRLISFFDSEMRIIEQMVFGAFNKDATSRDISLVGVGHMNPMDYFQQMLSDECEAGRGLGRSHFYGEDIAGWDTRIAKRDLMDEWVFFKTFGMEPRQEKIAHTLYRIYANHNTLIKREVNGAPTYRLLKECKGRLSGYILTYTMNTVTNFKKTLAHICDTFKCTPEEALTMVERREINLYISGDDKVVAGPYSVIEAMANNVNFWNETGFARKDIGPEEPSPITADFREVEFCSHKPTPIEFDICGKKTIKYLPTRSQDELFAKCVYSVGQIVGAEQSVAHAKLLMNSLVAPYIFKRDMRKLAEALASFIPVDMVPMGKISAPIQMGKNWMYEKDFMVLLRKIYSDNSKWKVEGPNGEKITCMSQIKFQSMAGERDEGTLIFNPRARRKWLSSMRTVVAEYREILKDWPLPEDISRSPDEEVIADAGYDLRNVAYVGRSSVGSFVTIHPDDIDLQNKLMAANKDGLTVIADSTAPYCGGYRISDIEGRKVILSETRGIAGMFAQMLYRKGAIKRKDKAEKTGRVDVIVYGKMKKHKTKMPQFSHVIKQVQDDKQSRMVVYHGVDYHFIHINSVKEDVHVRDSDLYQHGEIEREVIINTLLRKGIGVYIHDAYDFN